MSDVIIAIVPAPGHEGLVAEGPSVPGCTPERPMTIDVERPGAAHPCVAGCLMNIFGEPSMDLSSLRPGDECPACYGRGLVSVTALVLYAPRGPRLGMVRAMEAAALDFVPELTRFGAPVDGTGGRVVYLRLASEEAIQVRAWPPDSCRDVGPLFAFGVAHLLHQRGLASEVLVLPVPA